MYLPMLPSYSLIADNICVCQVPTNQQHYSFQSVIEYTSIEKMASEKLTTYSRTGGIVIGVIEIVLGLVTFLFQIPQFTEQLDIAIASTGFWAGLYVST